MQMVGQMFQVLGNYTYFRLFSAQVFSLLGSGLMTVALALIAYELWAATAPV